MPKWKKDPMLSIRNMSPAVFTHPKKR